MVQALPSSQLAIASVWVQPMASWQMSFVHTLLSSHAAELTVPTHFVWLQVSPLVQATPSLHGEVLAACVQPAEESQESSVQGLPSSQFTAAPLLQFLLLHRSPWVHALPSLHGVPSAIAVLTQAPVLALQLPGQQGVPSQTVAVPLQELSVQVSAVVHKSPSEQAAPAVNECKQALLVPHPSAVQGSPSSQLTSSTWPSQSLSAPSQLSVAATGASHALSRPVGLQER